MKKNGERTMNFVRRQHVPYSKEMRRVTIPVAYCIVGPTGTGTR
jgi:hypothetical protein